MSNGSNEYDRLREKRKKEERERENGMDNPNADILNPINPLHDILFPDTPSAPDPSPSFDIGDGGASGGGGATGEW